MKRDERADFGRKSFVQKLKKEYKFKLDKKNNLADFYELLQGTTLSDSTFQANLTAASLNKPAFSFAKKKYTQADFADYLLKNTSSNNNSANDIIDAKFNDYIERELMDYEDNQLEKKYDDFRLLMQEYHDGILLFEVSNEQVWEKASKDTEGLAAFFSKNKENYTWEKPYFKGRIVHCKTEDAYVQAQTIITTQVPDSIDKQLRLLNDPELSIKIEKGLYAEGDNKHVDHQIFKTTDKLEKDEKLPYVIVSGKTIEQPEEYTDVRGLVTADYQEYLEKEWITYLRDKYSVNINQKVLKKVQKN